MGCDIHLHIEIKVDGQWHHYNHPQIPRNYWLFAKMANVRNYDTFTCGLIEPISQPKGFPDDATFTTKFDYEERWGDDAHSASWLNAKEIQTLAEWWRETFKKESYPQSWFEASGGGNFGYLFGNGYESFLKYKGKDDGYPRKLEDVRFVFWFDN